MTTNHQFHVFADLGFRPSPQEAPLMIAEKHRLVFSVSYCVEPQCFTSYIFKSVGDTQVWQQAELREGAGAEAEGGEWHHEEEVQRPPERH